MRGTLQCFQLLGSANRITPAYAGNTANPLGKQIRAEDHPRVCGEHFKMPSGNTGVLGSPPRMRGTHKIARLACARMRITPAYAGNTIYYSIAKE